MTRPKVLIVGAGFAGFHCARELERLLRPDEAELTLARPVDYMLYSPLLPQVAAGVITPQATAVSLRRALRRILRAPCWITGIDLDTRTCVARAVTGEVHTVPWDYLVLCPGSVTRTFGTPGGEQHGRGMKTLAQVTHLHDHVLAELELGNAVADAQRRAAHCTFVVAGTGYAGVETAAALHLLTRRLLPRFINLRPEDRGSHGQLGLETARSGRLRVTQELHVAGRPDVFSAGDAAAPDLDGDLDATPSLRTRMRTATDWLMHAALGDDFTQLGLPDPMHGTLADQEATGQYLSADDARQTAARILAHDLKGWST